MEDIELNEGNWIRYIEPDGLIRIGRVEKKWENDPFNEENFRVYVPGLGSTTIEVKQIIEVYPKVYIKINPSRRK